MTQLTDDLRAARTSSASPSLREISEQIPLGHECRSCGASSYNWVIKCSRYLENGDICCGEFRKWVDRAIAAAEAQDA